MKMLILWYKSRRFRRFLAGTEAVSALEYAILVGVIAAAIGAVLVTFGGNITTAIQAFGTTVAGITPPPIPTAPASPPGF